MLIARCSNGMFILGIDADNVRMLKEGKPILKALSLFGGTDDIAIVYGDTLDDIRAELKRVYGEVPDPTPLPEPH